MNKRKFILIGIFVLLVICLYISLSYSYYLIGNDKVEIETAMESPSCVGISIDSGEAFSLNGDYAVPITNAQFLNSKPETQDIYKYSFTITNSCEGQDLNGLTIGLVPLNGSDLPISNLKYILIKSDENTNSFTESNIKEFIDESVKKLPKGMMQQLSNSYGESATNVYPVGSTSLSGKNSVSYDLYVWIGSRAGNETMDQTFNAAVVLYDEETIIDVLLKSDVGDGELIHHTEDLSNGAGDGGYRYSGDDPNNFICFGKGSEKYNWGKEDSCPLENKYRIIGYVPVEVNGNQEFRIKVIKAEYLTEDEFGTKAGTASRSSTYEGIKRIESPQYPIPAYKWNDTSNNNWKESSLYTSLNSPDYIDDAFGENWKDKIETVTWNVGGVSTYSKTPKAFYEDEATDGGCYNGDCEGYPIKQGSGTTVEALIGLMYLHDYGFASSINWDTNLDSYGNANNRNNNWMFNGVYEWTISRNSSNTTGVLRVSTTGSVGGNFVSDAAIAVRPVFYLKSDVNLVKEETADGSKAHPFKIANSPEPPPTLLDVCPESGNLAKCFQNIGNKTLDVGDGELNHHTPDDSTSAGDGGYRYSGNQPNNYICFGSGSEDYNKGTPGETCDIKNKYRIIGYVPVILADGSSTSLIKVIKAEYLTEDEFGTKAGTVSTMSSYAGIKRIEAEYGNIPAYQWNDTFLNNNWGESTLYKSLNSDEPNGYKNKAFGDTWLNKIENVRWNVGGANDYELTAQAMYEEEMKVQGAITPVDSKIGLMYAHDYGFASSSDNWQTEINNYDKDENRDNNWLFNGVSEWTISRDSSVTNRGLYVTRDGDVLNNLNVNHPYVAVRPVFYLKSDVEIINDGIAVGTRSNPLRVGI